MQFMIKPLDVSNSMSQILSKKKLFFHAETVKHNHRRYMSSSRHRHCVTAPRNGSSDYQLFRFVQTVVTKDFFFFESGKIHVQKYLYKRYTIKKS